MADLEVSVGEFVDSSFNASGLDNDTVMIMLPPDVFENETMDASVVFSMFSSSELYPLTNKTFDEFNVASTVVSATVIGSKNISANITVILKLNSAVCDINSYKFPLYFSSHIFLHRN